MISQIPIKQNYFQFQDILYIPEEGLMSAPPSSIFSAINLKYIENTKLVNILLEHHILGYFRYVDDILIMYKNDSTDTYDALDTFNNIFPDIKFTMEEEKENQINFLDITISKVEDSTSFSIYRKPTTTDTIIPNGFRHPHEHILAAIIYLIEWKPVT
jgi:hypothetical protein